MRRVTITRGSIWRDRGSLDRALADFDKAIQLDPNFAPAHNNRGLAWYDKKNYERAIASFDQAIKLSPTFARAFVNRGNAL